MIAKTWEAGEELNRWENEELIQFYKIKMNHDFSTHDLDKLCGFAFLEVCDLQVMRFHNQINWDIAWLEMKVFYFC